MAETCLTVQQQKVVDDRGGTLLVSAAAGSGKTKVLVDRVLRRIVDDGKNIHEFLIITFTNAAAAELRGKISDAISKELAKNPDSRHLARQLNLLHMSQISTVHAFCGALIRQYGYLLEVPADYRMLEEQEGMELLGKLLDALLEEQYEKRSPDFCLLTDTLGAGRTDQPLRELVLSLYDRIQSQPYPQRWLKLQQVILPEDMDLSATEWGRLLTRWASQRLRWLMGRYDWAIGRMQGDAALEKQYLPCYEMQRKALEEMLTALNGSWDDIAPALDMEYPRVSVRNYEDKELLEAIKAVKSDGKDLLEELRQIFGRRVQELRDEQNALAPALRALMDLAGELDKRFSAEKRRKNLLDFSDQEHLAIRLLLHPETGRPTDVAAEVSARFTEIMVDEYQDTNRVQELIFRAIAAGADENRFLVGDVKQSIYGFRQAEPGIFLEKYRTFTLAETAASGQPRKLVLSKNFRSRPEVLEAVNHVFASVMSEDVGDIIYGPEERLYPGLEEYPERKAACVELHVLDLAKQDTASEDTKYQREAQWVARRIQQLLINRRMIRDGSDLRPVTPGDVAILLRTRDTISVYGRMLRRAGIPVASGGGENLFETPEGKVLLNLLRVLENPHQDIPLLAVLCSPVFRLSNQQLAEIRTGSKENRLYDALRACNADWAVAAVERLEALRTMAGTVSADRLVWRLLHETGLLAAYSAMEGGARRRENLLTIYQMALSGASGGYLHLYQLVRQLERAAEAGTQTVGESTEGVTITTMHRSKGLEYPVVILADLSRKFNFRELTNPVLFDSDLGIGAKMTDTELRVRYPGLCYEALKRKKQQSLLSEELRILYVAMTRPKDLLIMTYAKENAASTLASLRPGVGCPAEPWAVSDCGCLGDWVLLAAMGRVEAGDLFEVAGRPDCTLTVSDFPWKITYGMLETVTLPLFHWQDTESQTNVQQIPLPQQLAERLSWQDAHHGASVTPSKLTATQLKGRDKDTEAAEGAKVRPQLPQLQRPEFVQKNRGLTPTEKGTAVHLFLQYANFVQCQSVEEIQNEKYRLEDEEFMTPQQLEAVQPECIVTLFQSKLGRKILSAEKLIREFKFSILVDAEDYYPEAVGEKILLQGVVDAAIEEPDGLIVVDFKTDRVSEASVSDRADHYRSQLETYDRALRRIFQKPVKEKYLYFLSIGKAVQL